MKATPLLRASAVLAIGAGVAGGLYLALLNVPESNVLALCVSALLVLLIIAVAGFTLAAAAALGQDFALPATARRAVAALPGFVVALGIFALLWWLTESADASWQAQRGEVDAVIMLYLGKTQTAWLHETVSGFLWLIRWALGLSIVAGLVVTATGGGLRSAPRGLRLSVRPLPLGAATVGLLFGVEGLWRLAYWRPSHLPPSWVESAFAALKLGVLYLIAAAMVALVLRIYSSTAARG